MSAFPIFTGDALVADIIDMRYTVPAPGGATVLAAAGVLAARRRP